MNEGFKIEPTISLQRNLLGSISIEDVLEEDETEADRKAYCAAIFAVFPRLEKDLKKFLHAQLLYSANEAETWERVIFGRGSFNGMALLLENWKIAAKEHEANSGQKEDFDKHSPISEVGSVD